MGWDALGWNGLGWDGVEVLPRWDGIGWNGMEVLPRQEIYKKNLYRALKDCGLPIYQKESLLVRQLQGVSQLSQLESESVSLQLSPNPTGRRSSRTLGEVNRQGSDQENDY